MIAAVALLVCILAGYMGFQVGFFRAASMFGAALLAGLAAFNWGVPAARALAPEAPGTATIILVVAFLAGAGVLFYVCYRLSPSALRMPWLLDDLGGAAAGAALGWIAAGVLVASARFTPDVDSWIRRTRGDDRHLARSTPDGFWFAIVGLASDGGLQRSPKRPFKPSIELPTRTQ